MGTNRNPCHWKTVVAIIIFVTLPQAALAGKYFPPAKQLEISAPGKISGIHLDPRPANFMIGLDTAKNSVTLVGLQNSSYSEITQALKDTIDQVIKIVTDENLKNNKAARRQLLRETIAKRFNYRQMVMRTLAHHWGKRTPEEQERFLGLFKRHMEKSYARHVENFRGGDIDYLEEVVRGKYAMVKTLVIRKTSALDVNYKLIKENGNWQVYDMVIKGVSMIRNYRNQFSRVIRKESFEALMEKLNDPDMKIESGEQAKTPTREENHLFVLENQEWVLTAEGH